MIKRRVHRVFKKGSIDKLTLVEEELSALEEGEVTVKVKAIGFNFADIFAIKGLYSATPKGSFVPGLEFAGEIEDAGNSSFEKGQRVMGVTRFGAYTDHLNIDHRYLTIIPEDWTFKEGAAFQVQVLTAYYALVPLGAIQKDYKVLIHSAAGGVGLWANRICKKLGAYTIGTVGSNSKFDVLKEEGYDQYLVRGNNFKESYIREIGEDIKPNLVLECIGGKVLMDSYKLMERMGRLISYGSANFASDSNGVNYVSLFFKYLKRPKFDPMKMMSSNKSVMAFNLIWLFSKSDLYNQYMSEIMEMNMEKPRVGHTYPFEQAKEALRLFQTGKTTGKVVLEI